MMKPDRLVEGLTGLTNLATASGMPTTDQVWALLVTALAIADDEMPMGTSRDEWLEMCGHAYDKMRQALAAGPAA